MVVLVVFTVACRGTGESPVVPDGAAVASSPFFVKGVVYGALGDPLAGAGVETADRQRLHTIAGARGEFSFDEPMTGLVPPVPSKARYREFRRDYGPSHADSNRVFWMQLESTEPPGLPLACTG